MRLGSGLFFKAPFKGAGRRAGPGFKVRVVLRRLSQDGRSASTAKARSKMKVKNSLKSLLTRHRANRLVRRRGRVYIINKTHRKFKARQG